MSRGLIYLLLWSAYTSACLLAGVWTESNAKNAEIDRLKLNHATQQRVAAEAALLDFQGAQARADQLQNRLAAADRSRQTQALEHAREIKRLATGRPCLNAGLVGLLNGAGGTAPAAVPETAGQPAAADAAAASDSDVAGWIDHAQRQYDACRDRVQALSDFHQGPGDD